MAVVGMKQLLEAGVHFGHQTRRWNPKMKPYIYTERNGIHIIDLQKTVSSLEKAYGYVRDVTRDGGKVLFVGTKKQAQEAVAEEATRAGQYYVNQRWLGGLLTNFQTIQQRLRRLDHLEAMRDSGEMESLPKKEQLKINDEIAKLSRMLGGIRGMRRLPDALFVVDTKKEHIAIHEAQRLDIPIVALLDTNSDPDEVDYAIPANDDAIRAVRLLAGKMADAAFEGVQERQAMLGEEGIEGEEGEEADAFEGSYSADPEGYVAALDDADVDDTLTVSLASAEPDEDGVVASGSAAPVEDVPDGEPQPENVADAEGIAAEGDTGSPVIESNEQAAGGIMAQGEDALHGDIPPAADEAALGVHPDAAE